VFEHLQIADPWERRLVAAADVALWLGTMSQRMFRARTPEAPLRRVLLVRLERIGDLLMTLPAIAAVRRLAPAAALDLVVGSWNAPLAGLIPGISRVITADARWLARGNAADSWLTLARRARGWHRGGYDLAINFEGDIRSHVLTAMSGARRRVGFDHGGGGPLLTDRVQFDPRRHTVANAARLVAEAFAIDREALERECLQSAREGRSALSLDEPSMTQAASIVAARPSPLIGVHVSGGREIKQWPPDRFAEVASRLAAETGGTLVLTGAPSDRTMVASVAARLRPAQVVDVSGTLDLPSLAAVLERLVMLVTGDTGPMHLSEAVGTPVVAIFGPSDPTRYGPRLPSSRTVRVDLPCSPCNRIRRPPERCVGHTPDCLAGVDVDAVADAARQVLESRRTFTARAGTPQVR
jgi:ADP-heptose:LPS heptosyltransferase